MTVEFWPEVVNVHLPSIEPATGAGMTPSTATL
jgi:hypothetical protein